MKKRTFTAICTQKIKNKSVRKYIINSAITIVSALKSKALYRIERISNSFSFYVTQCCQGHIIAHIPPQGILLRTPLRGYSPQKSVV